MRKHFCVQRLGALTTLGLALALTVARPAHAEEEPDAPATAMPRITLAEALRRALSQNVSVVVALEEIRRAEALVREARSGSMPTLTGNGVYTHLDGARKANLNGNSVTFVAQDQLAANITLTVPLLAPKQWAQWSHAKSNEQAVRASAEDVRRQTAVTVARAFLTVVAQKHVVDVDEHAFKTSKAHYDYAHTRFAGGVGNRVDEVRAEQQMVANQALVESSYAALARAREALGVLLGIDGPMDAQNDIALPSGPSLDAALADSATKRPDVIAQRQRFVATDQIRKDTYADYLPFVVGVVQPFYQNPATLTQPQTGWLAQLVLTIPFYDGGLRYGLSAEREAASNEARAMYDNLVRQARADVRVSFEAVKRAEAALAASVIAAKLARSALELATIAYQAGATTNLEVIDAERAAHQADTAAAVAEDTAGQARIDLLAASGRFP